MFSQRNLAQVWILVSVFAAISISSTSFAQFEFPGSGVSKQVSGSQYAEPYGEGPRSVYVTDDFGHVTCAWNCEDKVGEAGRPRLHKVMIIGRDERNDEAAYLTEEQQDTYSNVGRIECPYPGDLPGSTRRYVATGWISKAKDTAVTNSHAFIVFKDPPANPNDIRFDPLTCKFSTYDRFGTIRDSVDIGYASLKWDDPKYYGDVSHDFAIIKFVRAPYHAVKTQAFGNAKTLNGADIHLIAFHNDVSIPRRPRITRGKIFPMPESGVFSSGRHYLYNYERMFVTTADTMYGSSGGLFIDPASGMAIGINVGSNSFGGATQGEFDIDHTNNYGIYFDIDFLNEIRRVAEMPPLKDSARLGTH